MTLTGGNSEPAAGTSSRAPRLLDRHPPLATAGTAQRARGPAHSGQPRSEPELATTPPRWARALQALPFSVMLALAALMVVREGGFAPTVWYPVALVVLGFAVVLVLGAGSWLGDRRRVAVAAIACLGLYVSWSFLSIHWAAASAMAWQGSDRDLLYLLVFALLASWPVRSHAVWPPLLAAGAAISLEGVFTVFQAAHSTAIADFMIGTRLSEPLGYPNATAALYMMLAWLMFGLATRLWLPAPARGLAFGLAGVDVALNLLTQSRGSIFTLPLVAIAYFLLVPGRLRSLAALALLGLGVAPALGSLLSVYAATPSALPGTLERAIELSLVSGAVLAVAGWLFARADERWAASPRTIRLAGATVWGAIGVGIAAIVAFAAPWRRIAAAWHSFKYSPEPTGVASHFGGLGSNRYDFWRVGLIEFSHHPLEGIGIDNFQVPYLQLGHSSEQPLYPHSLLIDLLSQTGVVGFALFGAFAVLAFVAITRIAPGRDRELAGVLAVGSCVWLTHGLVDWLWEMPVLGVLGMALLGTACGLGARRRVHDAHPRRWGVGRVALVAAGITLTVAAAVSFAAPWLAARDVQLAEQTWSVSPARAFTLLNHADSLNPLDDQADVVAGAIASRLGRYGLMRVRMGEAVQREPDDWYANLELGIAASLTGAHALAAASLERAAALDPRDPVVASVLRTFTAGRTIDPARVDREFENEQ